MASRDASLRAHTKNIQPGGARPSGTSMRSVQSDLSVRSSVRAPSVRSNVSSRSVRSVSNKHHAPEAPAPSKLSAPPKLSAPQPQPEQSSLMTAKDKQEAKMRAEGRAKVPHTYRDSFKNFCFSPTGVLKVLRLSLIVGALVCFVQVQAREPYIGITVLEICMVTFFILSYVTTLQYLITSLHWPLLDLINSIITSVFLLVAAVLVKLEKNRQKLFYIGGTLCLTAAVVCLLDAFVVTKKIRTTVKTFLHIERVKKPSTGPGHSQMHVSSSHYSNRNY